MVPPPPPVVPQTPFAQTKPPQQTMSLSQEPPLLWQQFRTPSESIPFDAQTVAPAAWLHCPVCEHSAPSGSPPVRLFVQRPSTQ
jgi:hypothetical protein